VPKGLLPRCRGTAFSCRDTSNKVGHLAQCGKLREVGAAPPCSAVIGGIGKSVDAARCAKKQLIHRLPSDFVRRILKDFNSGALDAPSAAARLGVSRARLYQLRTDYLKNKPCCSPSMTAQACLSRAALSSATPPWNHFEHFREAFQAPRPT
jgi:hypothetical protein